MASCSIKFHLLFLVLALKVCFQKMSADSNSVGDFLSKYLTIAYS